MFLSCFNPLIFYCFKTKNTQETSQTDCQLTVTGSATPELDSQFCLPTLCARHSREMTHVACNPESVTAGANPTFHTQDFYCEGDTKICLFFT